MKNDTVQPNPLRVAVIIGSTREGRFAPTVAKWFASQAEARPDIAVDLIDLAEAQLPQVMTGAPDASVAQLGARLANADAFVIVTPEYNHSFPASLKNAIDWYRDEWRAKPVGFVAYGGVSGGLRAVEQLRQVFAELHAVSVRDTVSFHGASSQFGPDGLPTNLDRANRGANVMLNQIVWWAQALRDAKSVRPYKAA